MGKASEAWIYRVVIDTALETIDIKWPTNIVPLELATRQVLQENLPGCVLAWTGGVCPVTMCAKGLYNGPCGGTDQGKCEISQDQPCAWFEIYGRLAGQDRLDLIKRYYAIVPWQNQKPRALVQPGYQKPEQAE